MTIKRTKMSVKELDILAQDMLTAALKVMEEKVGSLDGDLAGNVLSDGIVLKAFQTLIIYQLGDNYHDKHHLL